MHSLSHPIFISIIISSHSAPKTSLPPVVSAQTHPTAEKKTPNNCSKGQSSQRSIKPCTCGGGNSAMLPLITHFWPMGITVQRGQMNLATEFLQLPLRIPKEGSCLVSQRSHKEAGFPFLPVHVCEDTGELIFFICGFHWHFHQKGQCFGGWVCSLKTGGDSRV